MSLWSFFFFKHKTAYEMRISDWSSDVCSSDLAGATLHVLNLHLRSPLASPIPGQKLSAGSWRSLAGWAEGYFAATLKRSGQALEARLRVEQIFDSEPAALIAVCGDLNAGAAETPARLLQARVAATSNEAPAARVPAALEGRPPAAPRVTLFP